MEYNADLIKRKFEAAGITATVQADPRHWKLKSKTGAIVGYWPGTGTCWAYGKTFKPSIDSLISAMASGRIKMPADAQPGQCKSCGASMWWITTDKGKKLPLGESGEPHFVECPHADKHRKQ